MFKDIDDDDQIQYESVYRRVKKNFDKNQLLYTLNKITMFLGLGVLQGVQYVKALLQKISLVKQIFMISLQQEDDVQLPQEINLRDYPMSFSYYDHIFIYISQNINKNHVQYMRVKNKIDYFFNESRSLKGMLGIVKLEHHINSKKKMKFQLTNDVNE